MQGDMEITALAKCGQRPMVCPALPNEQCVSIPNVASIYNNMKLFFSDEQKTRHTWHSHITRFEDIKLREYNNVWHKGKAA